MKSEKHTRNQTTYTPEPEKLGIAFVLVVSIEQIIRARFLIKNLFLRDFNARYRQRTLGYLWIVVEPLIGVFGFVLMDHAGVLDPGNTEIPYPLYVLSGTIMWTSIVGAIRLVAKGLQSQADLILRTNVPKIALAVSGLSLHFYNVLIQYVVLCCLFVLFGVYPSWHVVFYIFAILPLIIFGAGLGLILSVVSVIAKDLTTIVTTIFGMIMYATPVVYLSAEVESEFLQKLIFYNPLTWIIEMTRTLFMGVPFEHWGKWFISMFFCIFIWDDWFVCVLFVRR